MEIIYFGNFSNPIQLWYSSEGFWLRETYTTRYLSFQHKKGNVYIMKRSIYDEIKKEKVYFPLYISPFIYLEWILPIFDSWYAYFLIKIDDSFIYNIYKCIFYMFHFDLRFILFSTLLKLFVYSYNKKEIVNPFFYNKNLLKTIIKNNVMDNII